MRRNFRELAAPIEADPTRKARADAELERLETEVRAYRRNLPQLRKARALTQQDLAKRLEITQGEVSKVERRTDMHLSTLAQYVEALGGRLELVAVFGEDRVPFAIGDLIDEETAEGVGGPVGELAAS